MILEPQLRQQRHKTAIKRASLSRPVLASIRDRILTIEKTFFDFGCGYGSDVATLKSLGYSSAGWDPYFYPQNPKQHAAVVNLGYVLNVIEDPIERTSVLQEAYGMAQECLVVAVRIDSTFFESRFGDGAITRDGSFQKIYSQSEFRSYVEGVLGKRLHVVEPGIGYVFKTQEVEQNFVSSKYLNRLRSHDQTIICKIHDTIDPKKIARLIEDLGRMPNQDEIRELAVLGRRKFKDFVNAAVIPLINKDRFNENRNRIRAEVLQAVAMTRIENHKFLSAKNFSREFQNIIKDLFGDYREACRQAEGLLYALGNEGEVRKAGCSSAVGKLLPDDLYVHSSALDHVPVMMKLMLSLGESIVGRVTSDILKFSLHGKSMSFLFYDNFDENPHPRLQGSIRVDFRTGRYQIRDYSKSENPPILHRKETFVADTYPLFQKFKRLTLQEEDAGLLGHQNIGYLNQWNALLAERNYEIRDHELIKGRQL